MLFFSRIAGSLGNRRSDYPKVTGASLLYIKNSCGQHYCYCNVQKVGHANFFCWSANRNSANYWAHSAVANPLIESSDSAHSQLGIDSNPLLYEKVLFYNETQGLGIYTWWTNMGSRENVHNYGENAASSCHTAQHLLLPSRALVLLFITTDTVLSGTVTVARVCVRGLQRDVVYLCWPIAPT